MHLADALSFEICLRVSIRASLLLPSSLLYLSYQASDTSYDAGRCVPGHRPAWHGKHSGPRFREILRWTWQTILRWRFESASKQLPGSGENAPAGQGTHSTPSSSAWKPVRQDVGRRSFFWSYFGKLSGSSAGQGPVIQTSSLCALWASAVLLRKADRHLASA